MLRCPATGETPAYKAALQKWQQDDAKVASKIAIALKKATAELVLTCTHADEIWDKLHMCSHNV